MFQFFAENKLICHNQVDSYINQLLCITHGIYQSLDDDLETRDVFLDISKAFDKIWHNGLFYKLKQNSKGNFFECHQRFFVSEKNKALF